MPLRLRRQGQGSTGTRKIDYSRNKGHFFAVPCPGAARAGGCGRCVSRDTVSGKVVHCHVTRRIPERNGGALCHLHDVTLVVSHAGFRLFSPSEKGLFFTTRQDEIAQKTERVLIFLIRVCHAVWTSVMKLPNAKSPKHTRTHHGLHAILTPSRPRGDVFPR